MALQLWLYKLGFAILVLLFVGVQMWLCNCYFTIVVLQLWFLTFDLANMFCICVWHRCIALTEVRLCSEHLQCLQLRVAQEVLTYVKPKNVRMSKPSKSWRTTQELLTHVFNPINLLTNTTYSTDSFEVCSPRFRPTDIVI